MLSSLWWKNRPRQQQQQHYYDRPLNDGQLMMRMRMVISLMVSLIITIVWPSSSFHRSSYLSANLFSITLVHAEPVVVNQQQSQQPNYIECK